MQKRAVRNLGFWTQNWAQNNVQIPNSLNRIQGLQAPLYGRYVQRFVENSSLGDQLQSVGHRANETTYKDPEFDSKGLDL